MVLALLGHDCQYTRYAESASSTGRLGVFESAVGTSKGPERGAEMNKSKKASARATASKQEASAAAAQSKTASQRKAVRSNAMENTAKRQFQKSRATAIQGHMRSSGQRRQAKRDSR